MANYTWRQVLHYRFDSFMARGGRSIFIALVVVFLTLLTSIAIIRGITLLAMPAEIAPERGPGFFHNVYITFLQMTDPGNMSQDIESSPWFKISAIIAGLAGVVMLSTLIAFITTALDIRLAELRKGHSKVIEKAHTLILGWNQQRVVEVLYELFIARESEGDNAVVILATEQKEEMDDFLSLRLNDTLNTRVITRSGLESSLVNLEVASADACKSVIALAHCLDSSSAAEKSASDVRVMKTVLAVMAMRPPGKELNVVAEIFDPNNREILVGIAPEEITIVDTRELLAKIIVQTSRSTGLSIVYNEILSFDGCEMYFHGDDWDDITFGELAFRFPDGIPLGLRHGDGTLAMNPPPDAKLAEDDDILILAEDDSTIEFLPQPVAEARDLQPVGNRVEHRIERELILGWTPTTEIMVKEYADYVLPGTTIDIMLAAASEDERSMIKKLDTELSDVTVRLIEGDPLRSQNLLAVEPFNFDNIIILSQNGHEKEPDRIDSETVIQLLLLRNIFRDHPEESANVKLITEVLDTQNRDLIARTGVKDFVVSNKYVSMVQAQISEDRDINRVYEDLLAEDGSEIYVKPAWLYFESFPAEATYADLIRLAQNREEVCLGVKILALEEDEDRNFGVKLIPEKDTKYTLTAEDTIVVLAEDDT